LPGVSDRGRGQLGGSGEGSPSVCCGTATRCRFLATNPRRPEEVLAPLRELGDIVVHSLAASRSRRIIRRGTSTTALAAVSDGSTCWSTMRVSRRACATTCWWPRPTSCESRVLSINLRGPYFLTQLVANQLIAQRGGTIPTDKPCGDRVVNVSSISATVMSTNPASTASPRPASPCADPDLGGRGSRPEGIVVYEVRPGVHATNMTAA